MDKLALLLILISALLLSACGGGNISSQDAARTAAAGTLNAQLDLAEAEAALATSAAEQTALAQEVNALETENAQLSVDSTETAVAEATLAATEPQLVPPEDVACRFGPDFAFARVADLPAGNPVDVLARSSSGDWWQVPSPKDPEQTCWVYWQQDLDFLGDVFNLPLVEGPQLPANTLAPTHEPGFSLSYSNNNTCGGARYAIFHVTNLGPETYRSAVVTMSDVTTASDELSRNDGNNEFLPTSDSCPKGNAELPPGASAYVAVAIKGTHSGDTLRVRVLLCTEKGYGGNCVVSAVEFVD